MEINYHLSYYITARYSDEILSFIWLDTIVLVFFLIPVEHLTQKKLLNNLYQSPFGNLYLINNICNDCMLYSLMYPINLDPHCNCHVTPKSNGQFPSKSRQEGTTCEIHDTVWWMNCLTANACHILFDIMTNFVNGLIGGLPCNEGLSHW